MPYSGAKKAQRLNRFDAFARILRFIPVQSNTPLLHRSARMRLADGASISLRIERLPPDKERSMATPDEILAEARKRARDNGLPYEGALLPGEAAQLMRDQTKAVLIDVRSRAEWDFVGRVPGAVEIEWKSYPGMAPNTRFVDELTAKVPKDAVAMFLCRSGGRSHETAATAARAGYAAAFNVLEGFEGDRDASGHRNSVGGWRAAGLPWTQS